MKKILLIRPEPDYPHLVHSFPHGLMYLAGYLRAREERDVRIIDLRVKQIPEEELKSMISDYAPDIVGVGLLTLEAQGAHKIAGLVKSLMPQCPVVFGGPHCSAPNAEKILSDENVNVIVVGEGEKTFSELVGKLTSGESIEDHPGTALKVNGSLVMNPPAELIPDLDEIPRPAFDLIDTADYFKFGAAHDALQSDPKWAPLFTSRGCPFRCVYCHNIFGKKIRFRSPENIFDEIKWLNSTYGIKNFHIEDDSFNINMDRAKKVFRLIKESGLDLSFSFPNGVRADFLDEELVSLFKQGGVYRVAIGIESASPRILKFIKKQLDLAKVNRAIGLLTSAGISAHGFFMMGFPDETLKEMQDTISFACRSDLHSATFSIVTPYPQTELYSYINDKQTIDGVDTAELYAGTVNIDMSQVPADVIAKLRRNAYMRFYLNPVRIWRIFWIMPYKMGILRNFLDFLKFVTGRY